jgi:clan AA aspartic protease
MLDFNRTNQAIDEGIGEVRVKVKLTNALDEALASRGLLNPNQLRVYETQALVNTGAVRTVLPMDIVQQLDLKIRSYQTARYTDGREEKIGLTEAVIIEVQKRETIVAALVMGDEVLIGKTALITLDLVVDSKNQCLIPNPKHPNYPIFRI